MTTPTLTTTRQATLETRRSAKPRVLVAEFGDGYSQRAKDGINSNPAEMSVVWESMTVADAKLLVKFFEDRAGAEHFYWTAPHDTTPKKWVCPDWTEEYPTRTYITIRATLREVF